MKAKNVLVLAMLLLLGVHAAAQDAAALKAQGDQGWAQRDNQTALLQAIDAYEKALALSPNDEDLLVRLSNAYYWKGNNLLPQSKKAERMEAYTQGMDYAQKICDSKADSPGGNFWFATNKASIGREKGIVKSASYLPELRKRMEIVEKQEPFYFNGGPQRFYSRIITKAPGFLRKSFNYSLEDAEKMLKEAVAKYPNHTMNDLYLGDVYVEMKKPDLARQHYQKVLDTPFAANPNYAPDMRRDKKIAKKRLAELSGGN